VTYLGLYGHSSSRFCEDFDFVTRSLQLGLRMTGVIGLRRSVVFLVDVAHVAVRPTDDWGDRPTQVSRFLS